MRRPVRPVAVLFDEGSDLQESLIPPSPGPALLAGPDAPDPAPREDCEFLQKRKRSWARSALWPGPSGWSRGCFPASPTASASSGNRADRCIQDRVSQPHFESFEYCDLFEFVIEYLVMRTERKKPMATLIPENFETVAPTEADALLARESSRRLATHKLGRRTSVRIQLLDDSEEAETVSVPTSALRLFLHLLTEMSQGNA